MKRDLDKQRWIKTSIPHRLSLNERYQPSFFNRLHRSIKSLDGVGPIRVFTVDEWVAFTECAELVPR